MDLVQQNRLLKDLLIEHVASLMEVDVEQIIPNISLIEIGLDSISLMRALDFLSVKGYVLKFEEAIARPTINDWLQNAKARPEKNKSSSISYIHDDNASFELTPVQQAYWMGRKEDQPLGGVSCQLYLEIDGKKIEPQILNKAIIDLLARHSMLRTNFDEDNYQKINNKAVDFDLTIHDLREQDNQSAYYQLEQLRHNLSHRVLPVEQDYPIDVQLTLITEHKSRLHINIDLLVADVFSLTIILRDLALFYLQRQNELPKLTLDFRQYLLKINLEQQEQQEAARQYWQERLLTLPSGPQLPLACDYTLIKNHRFTRRDFHLTNADLATLQIKAQSYGLTLANIFATAFGEVLARWSENTKFLLNIPLFNRKEIEPSVSHMVADFTNLILLEMNFEQNLAFVERAQDVQHRLYQDIANSAYSGVNVLRDMFRIDQGHARIAPVVFACNLGDPFIKPEVEEAFGKATWMISQTPQVWIDHQTYPTKDGLLLNWDVVEELFPKGMIDAMFNAYEKLIRALIIDDWKQPVFLPIPFDQNQIRHQVNNTTNLYPINRIHERFFLNARINPDYIAITGSFGSVSYRDLADLSLRIGGALQKANIGSGDVVAIALPRGVDQIGAVLGILSLNAIYLPISLDQPAIRTRKICERANVKAVITISERMKWEGWSEHVLCVDIHLAKNASPLASIATGNVNDSAYVIFTSGSTGEPKGVEITHKAAWNTIFAINEKFNINAKDRAIGLSALEFDLSVFDIFGLLSVGGALVVVDDQQRKEPSLWLDLAQQHQVTVWNSVPALLEMAILSMEPHKKLEFIRLVLVSGDWVPLDLPKRMKAISQQDILFIALGGATEAAIWSNFMEIKEVPDDWQSIPYGFPLPNQKFRIVNHKQQDCPNFVPGEIWIGGDGLSCGYKGDLTLSNERFIFVNNERWYRTGDRGCYWPDGTLEFLGRLDQQVKVRGYRIELAEIEIALERHPFVVRAIATIIGMGANQNIAAIVTLSSIITEKEILSFVRNELPDYMVPVTVLILDTLPLTTNGKIDRNSIVPILEQAIHNNKEVEELPCSDTEIELVKLWQDVLGDIKINRQDSFFRIGGNSLQAARLTAKINQKYHITLPLRVFLAEPTVAGVANFIKATIQKNDLSLEEGVL
ncbi:EntF [Commensalibacter communis]|uniref:amino acid adenylation domain-containing protein n=1 Tax=Commensalibacter communis TaxID=2972786 RepID=UPI0022FF70BC|nr:amino acid adenylation domain-containing protein [Commensalibacter communis]CAI3955392.1 EntF [Commensalibacter communis]